MKPLKKGVWVFLFIICIGISPQANVGNKVVYITEYEINFNERAFEGFFKEPFEILVLFWIDGKKPLALTSHEDWRINVEPNEIESILKKRDRKIKDIAFTVHNHLTPRRPTWGNHLVRNALKRLGFEGASFVYYPHSGMLRPIK